LGSCRRTRRVRLHGQVGEALEKRWGGRVAEERASRLAQHFVDAATLTPRHAEKAVRYSKLAAEQAEAATAWNEAARHYESCLGLIAASGTGLGEDEASLLVAAGRCFRYDAQYRAAWRSLMRATALFRDRGDGVGMARAALEASEIWAPRDASPCSRRRPWACSRRCPSPPGTPSAHARRQRVGRRIQE